MKSKFSSVSRVNVSTQTEGELSTEPLRNKISLGCQTETIEIFTNPTVNAFTSQVDCKNNPQTEDKKKLNYDGCSSDVGLVEDSDKLIKSLRVTQPKTAELFDALQNLIFQLQQKKIQCLGYSFPPNSKRLKFSSLN